MATSEIGRLSDRKLRRVYADERRAFEKLSAEEPATVEDVLVGKWYEHRAERMEEAGSRLERLNAEITLREGKALVSKLEEREESKRQRRQIMEQAPLRKALREEHEEKARRRAETAAASKAIRIMLNVGGPYGWHVGASDFRPANLTPDEGETLVTLLERHYAEAPEGLTGKDLERAETLVAKLAGDSQLFVKFRRQLELQETRKSVEEAERQASLVQRSAQPPRGSLILPGYLTRWIADQPNDFTPFDLGVLASIVGGIEYRSATLASSSIEEIADEVVLVVPPQQRPRVHPQDGSADVARAIDRLVKNRLVRRERRPDGSLLLGLGERLVTFYAHMEEVKPNGESPKPSRRRSRKTTRGAASAELPAGR